MMRGGRDRHGSELFAGIGLNIVVGGKALGHGKLLFIESDWFLAEVRAWIVLVID